MLFNSYVFLYAFLPIALAGYFLLARSGRVPAALWLVGMSLLFYGWWNPAYVPLLVLSIGGNHLLSRLIGAAEQRPRRQNWLLGLGIAANLGALGYYKYLGWLVVLLNGAAGTRFAAPGIVLPLGISFFTFTQLGYLIDCRQGVAKDRGLLNYLVFVTFFPHLIAGPILHNGEMMPQFAAPATYRFSADNFSVGLGIFVIGLLKKCLLADPIGAIVPAGFAHAAALPLFAAWHVALAYSLQLYFDFSGYSDMAIGLARMFNLRFPLNFNSPYKAASVIDYWQRWHMTLTRYLMTYPVQPDRAGHRAAAHCAWPGDVTRRPCDAARLRLAGGGADRRHHDGRRHLARRGRAVPGVRPVARGRICRRTTRGGSSGRRRAHGAAPGHAAHVGSVLLTYLCVLVGSVFFRAAVRPGRARHARGNGGAAWHRPGLPAAGVADAAHGHAWRSPADARPHRRCAMAGDGARAGGDRRDGRACI